jgi:hypothetical protein
MISSFPAAAARTFSVANIAKLVLIVKELSTNQQTNEHERYGSAAIIELRDGVRAQSRERVKVGDVWCSLMLLFCWFCY